MRSAEETSGEYDAIPDRFKNRKRWLLWDSSADAPRRPHWNGNFGISWSNPDEWHTFEEAVTAATTRASWGIGYVFQPDDNLYLIDIDGPFNEEREPRDWFPGLDRFEGAYMEWSPSGNGVHIPVEGKVPDWWSDSEVGPDVHQGVDVLTNKFCTFTGDTLERAGETVTNENAAPFLFNCYQSIRGESPRVGTPTDTSEYDDGDEWLDDEKVADALSHIDPDVKHSEWVRIGYAVHDYDSGPSGKRLFEDWSQDGGKYDDAAQRSIEAIWNNASSGSGVTVATLVKKAKANGWEVPSSGSTPTPEADTSQSLRDAIGPDWFDTANQVLTVRPTAEYEAEELAALLRDGSIPTEAVLAINETAGGEEYLEQPDQWEIRVEHSGPMFDDMSTQEIKNRVLEEIPDHRIAYLPTREEWLWCKDGVWQSNGTGFVRQWLDGYLGPYYSSHIRREVMDQLQARVQVTEQSFGGGPDGMIAAENGLIDLSAGKIAREIQPPDYIRWTLATELDPAADCPKWKQFLGQVVEASDIPLLQEFVGYCLRHWDVKRKKALMLLGPTDAGKSVFVDVIEALFGGEDSPATSSTSIQYLANVRWGPARLVNTALNTRSDLGQESIQNTGKLKELVAGDSLDAERKQKPVFQFQPTSKHIFAANRAPDRSVDDEAFWNRWLTVIFPQAIPRSEQVDNLDRQLIEELPGILNWAIEGYQRLEEQGHFTNEPLPFQNREKWERYGNSIEQWFERCTEEAPGEFTPKWSTDNTLGAYDSYVAYARENGLEVETDRTFTSELKAKEGVTKSQQRVDGERPHGYKGIALTDDAPGEIESESEADGPQATGLGSFD